jgi:hypothetical protein
MAPAQTRFSRFARLPRRDEDKAAMMAGEAVQPCLLTPSTVRDELPQDADKCLPGACGALAQ